MLTPESMLMMHTMRHAELLAELAARPRVSHRARRDAIGRARTAATAAWRSASRAVAPEPACCPA